MNEKNYKFFKTQSKELKKEIIDLIKHKKNEYKIRYLLVLLESTMNEMEIIINKSY